MLEETLNKALDYTRGNNTYLQCVNNNLEHAALAVRNMESGLRGDIQDLRSDFQSAAVGMYNMGQEIRNDIQASTAMNINAIQGMAMGITSDIRASTYAVVASQNMLNQTFKQGFSSVNNTINLGIGLLGNKIDVLSEEISSKLDEIQEILDNPRLTQSRELYRQSLISYKKGFYEEALEDCLGAVEKNKTDFISWYLLGLIYLFGAGENGNVINLDKAEEAFANAAKYIKPDIPKSNEAHLMASEIFYHLGFTRLAKSNDFLIENKIDESNTKLLEAENASSMAYQLSKENLIAGYEQAKSLHFLGKDDDSLKLLEELIRKEKNFAIKSVNDKNFESLWTDIEKLIERLKLEACQLIRESLDEFINKISSGIDTGHNSIIEKVRKTTLQNKETIINNVIELKKENIDWFNSKKDRKRALYKDIEQKDYFSVLDALTKLPSIYENIEVFVRNRIINTNNIVKRQIEEQQNLERKEALERRLREEKEEEERRLREQKLAEERRKQEEENRKIQEEEKRIKEEEEKRKRIRNAKKRIILISLLIGGIIGTVLWYLIDELFSYNSEMYQIVAGVGMVILCIPFTIAVSVLEGFWFFEDLSEWGTVLVCSCIVFAIPLFFAGFFYAEQLPLVGFSIITVFSGLVGLFFSKYAE